MDSSLRDLERAVVAGDEHARPSLATAYLRRGRPEDALRVVTPPGGDVSVLDAGVEQTAWEDALARLRPAGRGGGPAEYLDLVGFLANGRYAVLRLPHGLRIFDVAAGELVPPAQVPAQLIPHRATEAGLYCQRNGQVVLLRPGPPWEVEPILMPGLPDTTDASGEWVATRSYRIIHAQTQILRVREGEAELGRLISSDRTAFDWARYRVAWLDRGLLHFCSVKGREAPQRIALGDVAQAVGGLSFLRDGRLLLSPPLWLVDLDHPGPLRPLARGLTSGPARLSLDGQALLCMAGGWRPARLSLIGSARPRAQALTGKAGEVFWHPRADVVSMCPIPSSEGPAELLAFHRGAAQPRRLLQLPPGLRPFGWLPNGLGLLVVRQLGEHQGTLEVWGPDGEVRP